VAEEVSAIIPAYNEADVIANTVSAALRIPGVAQVIVVDDCSSDGTAAAARAAGAHAVISLPKNLGKGGALSAGLKLAENPVILLLDADLGDSAVDAEKLVSPVLAGDADMTIGIFGKSRPSSGKGFGAKSGGMGLVVKTARIGIKMLTGCALCAPLSGQRAVRREILDRAGGFAGRFGVEVGLSVDALRMGYKVVEVPVEMVHRASGRDLRGALHRAHQLLDVICTLAGKAVK
jgi:hypothetical protein